MVCVEASTRLCLSTPEESRSLSKEVEFEFLGLYTCGVNVEGKEVSLVVIGEKCRGQLVKDERQNFKLTIADVAKSTTTFAQVGGSTEMRGEIWI